jgi:hypothetical protein
MISWWPGDHNTTDIVSGNNGTWIGNEIYGAGEVADAFSFDGGSYLSMGSPPSLNITGNQVTIDGWIYPTVTNNDVVYFGSTAYGANDYALIFQFDQLTGMIKAGGSEPIVIATAGPYVPALNQWTHIALTYDGATMKLYANGAVIGTLAHTGNIDGDGSEFAIGGRTNDCCGRHFNFTGRVDEVEVFDRALSDAEIAAIYNAGSAGKCRPLPISKRVFVSSVGLSANFGGYAAADATCQLLANSASLGGTWMAWVSDANSSPSFRFTQSPGPYTRVDGTPIAANWADLTDGALLNGITTDEYGSPVTNNEVWTSTSTSGTYTGGSCNNFTDNSNAAPFAYVGISDRSDYGWTQVYLQFCDRHGLRIYCFEQ